jgi:hypothetical protein
MDKIDYKHFVGFSDPEVDRDILKDSRGVKRSKTLFLETIEAEQVQGGYRPLYTLCPEEKKDLPSAYQIFINSSTEEEAAVKLVGSLPHWRFLCNRKWFLFGDAERIPGFEGLEVWREDTRALKRAEMVRQLKAQAEKGNVAAMKQLLVEADRDTKRNLSPKQKIKAVKDSRQDVLDLINRKGNG